MNELDGPDPVRDLMVQDKVDKTAEYKARVEALESQMAIAGIIIMAIKTPPPLHRATQIADQVVSLCESFLVQATKYIRKWPKGAKFD